MIYDIDITNENSETPESIKAEAWTGKINNYVLNLKSLCKKKQLQHDACGHYFRRREVAYTLPTIIIPSVSGPLVVLLASYTNDTCNSITLTDYFAAFGFVLTAIFTNITTFFKYGIRSSKHFTYASKYSDICTDIEAEIVKSKKYRINSNVFIITIKMKYDNLLFCEPVIPTVIEKHVQ